MQEWNLDTQTKAQSPVSSESYMLTGQWFSTIQKDWLHKSYSLLYPNLQFDSPLMAKSEWISSHLQEDLKNRINCLEELVEFLELENQASIPIMEANESPKDEYHHSHPYNGHFGSRSASEKMPSGNS